MHPQNVAETWPFHHFHPLDWTQKQILEDSTMSLHWNLPSPFNLSFELQDQYLPTTAKHTPICSQQNTPFRWQLTPFCRQITFFGAVAKLFKARLPNVKDSECHCFTAASWISWWEGCGSELPNAKWASLRWPCNWPVWHVVLNSRVYHSSLSFDGNLVLRVIEENVLKTKPNNSVEDHDAC